MEAHICNLGAREAETEGFSGSLVRDPVSQNKTESSPGRHPTFSCGLRKHAHTHTLSHLHVHVRTHRCGWSHTIHTQAKVDIEETVRKQKCNIACGKPVSMPQNSSCASPSHRTLPQHSSWSTLPTVSQYSPWSTLPTVPQYSPWSTPHGTHHYSTHHIAASLTTTWSLHNTALCHYMVPFCHMVPHSHTVPHTA